MFEKTPSFSEKDLAKIQSALYQARRFSEDLDGMHMLSAKLILWSSDDDKPAGTLTFDGNQWLLTPWNDSWVEDEDDGSEADMVQAPL